MTAKDRGKICKTVWQAVGSRLKESKRDGANYTEAKGEAKSSEESGRSRKVNEGGGKGRNMKLL